MIGHKHVQARTRAAASREACILSDPFADPFADSSAAVMTVMTAMAVMRPAVQVQDREGGKFGCFGQWNPGAYASGAFPVLLTDPPHHIMIASCLHNDHHSNKLVTAHNTTITKDNHDQIIMTDCRSSYALLQGRDEIARPATSRTLKAPRHNLDSTWQRLTWVSRGKSVVASLLT
jgi:hypothetical protein